MVLVRVIAMLDADEEDEYEEEEEAEVGWRSNDDDDDEDGGHAMKPDKSLMMHPACFRSSHAKPVCGRCAVEAFDDTAEQREAIVPVQAAPGTHADMKHKPPRCRYQIELSETALGHSKLSELLSGSYAARCKQLRLFRGQGHCVAQCFGLGMSLRNESCFQV